MLIPVAVETKHGRPLISYRIILTHTISLMWFSIYLFILPFKIPYNTLTHTYRIICRIWVQTSDKQSNPVYFTIVSCSKISHHKNKFYEGRPQIAKTETWKPQKKPSELKLAVQWMRFATSWINYWSDQRTRWIRVFVFAI